MIVHGVEARRIAPALAAIHERSFAELPGAPWTARAIAEATISGAMLVVDDAGAPTGFALARIVLDEAEVLTVAVSPAHRRQGHGRALLAEVEAAARVAGVATIHIEVDGANMAARALYAAAGFTPAGLRRGYYGPGRDAILLMKALGKPKSAA